jgi:hypothetical protein
VDKQLYNEALKIKNQQTIKNNETIKLNNEMNKIMKSHKLMNKTLDHAKNVYQQLQNDEPKLNMVVLQNNKAFRHILETYIISPIESNLYNYEKFLDDIKYRVQDLLEQQLMIKKGLRIQFTFLSDFYLPTDEEKKLDEKNFNSSCLPVVNNHDISKNIDLFIDDIKLQISEFQTCKSGWVFYRCKSLIINSCRYKPLKGSSFIELHH